MGTRYTSNVAPAGKRLFILNLSAEASLTNGFRNIKELLMQRRNVYLNHFWKLLTEEGIDVYTGRMDAFTIQQTQVHEARELLNWAEGIGSWRLNKAEDIKFPMDESLMTLRENKVV